MPSTEHHKLDRVFEWRLKVALDRIVPPPSFPRYASKSMGRLRPWRVAPLLLVAATAVLLVVAATATTGSPNPAVWTGDAASTIGSVVVEPSPSAEPTPAPPAVAPRKTVAPATAHQPAHAETPRPEPSERPEESPRPQPSVSPSPSDDHPGSSSPSPSPQPGDH
jgi:outer membrane biosynthesis protein TonB